MKDVGTLKELGVCVGDVVECVHEGDGQNSYEGILWECLERHPRGYCNVPCIFFKERGTGWMYADDDEWVFRIISRASAKPKLWKDMTAEEKGAFLLASHEGAQMQYKHNIDWQNCNEVFSVNYAYRIKPEPKVETVTVMYPDAPYGFRCDGGIRGPTHSITFQTIDGKPECASVKMEEL